MTPGVIVKERVNALAAKRSKSPSHIEALRSAVVSELEDWRDGLVIAPVNLILAVERYDAAKGKK